MTTDQLTDRVLSHPHLREATALYLGRNERRQFERETYHHTMATDAAILGLKHPDGAFAQYRGLDVYEVDALSHFGVGL